MTAPAAPGRLRRPQTNGTPKRRPLTPGDPRHGTVTGYSNHKCRCPDCRKAWAVYFGPRCKAYRARNVAAGLRSSGKPRTGSNRIDGPG
jgi:hypothetical protein